MANAHQHKVSVDLIHPFLWYYRQKWLNYRSKNDLWTLYQVCFPCVCCPARRNYWIDTPSHFHRREMLPSESWVGCRCPRNRISFWIWRILTRWRLVCILRRVIRLDRHGRTCCKSIWKVAISFRWRSFANLGCLFSDFCPFLSGFFSRNF